jgi:hypothetical protein
MIHVMDPLPPDLVPPDAGEVARRVRGITGVPWARLFHHLRPHLAPFSIAIADCCSAPAWPCLSAGGRGAGDRGRRGRRRGWLDRLIAGW